MTKMVIKITLDGEVSIYEVQGADNERQIISDFIKCDERFLDDAKFELMYKDLKFHQTVDIDEVIEIQDIINMHDLDLEIIYRSLNGAYDVEDSIIRKIANEGYFAHIEVDTVDEAVIELAKSFYESDLGDIPTDLRYAIDWQKVGKSYAKDVIVVESSMQKYSWFVISSDL